VATKQRWNELSEGTRRLIILGAVFDGILKIVALIDIARRPAAQIRGSKARWATAVVLVNSLGAVPLAYLKYGRRRESGEP
jgi:hypothetical protein